MQLTKSQNKVIEELFEEYVNGTRNIIDFSAPTGSGKTFMIANLISKIFASNINNIKVRTMIVVATISNAELPKAFSTKLEEYKQFLPFKDFEVEFRKSPSSTKNLKIEHIKNFELENNKVLVFGTSSFGRKKLFTEMGLLDNFIIEAKEKNWNIIYIRDEAHRGGVSNRVTSASFYKKFDDRMIDIAQFTIQMTATPKGYNELIELKEEDLSNDDVYLLKNNSIYNDFQRNTSTSEDLIRECLKKFKKVQNEYKKLPIYIRPALLIQVDSKNKNISQNDYYKTIDKIINIVSKEYKFNYLKYFSSDIEGNAKEDLTLESASKIDSNYDVIIFKVGPATGWDIPRACMLLQIREVSSETLNIQTVGRIKRNPMNNLIFNEITNKYYIYSNYQEGTRSLASYKLKEMFHNLKLYQGNLFLDKNSINLLEKKYYQKLKKFLNESAIKDLIIENSKKSILSIEDRNFNNKNATINSYSIFAESIFKLKIWNDIEISQNKKYFTKGLEKIIYDLNKNLFISIEIVKYTILKEYLSKIKDLFFESYKLVRKNEKYKLISNKSLKKDYQIWISNNDENKFDITDIKEYGYTLIRSINDKNARDIQYLDSEPEKEFMKLIFEELDEVEEYRSNINFFSKMPTLSSEIFFEYFKSEDNKKNKAFIDFALVSKQKILMIEVKGWSDYDEEKTKDLLFAFSKYKKQNPNVNLDLLVCYSGKLKGNFKKPEISFLKNKKLESISIRKALKQFFGLKQHI